MAERTILDRLQGFRKVCETMIGPAPAAIGKLGTIELDLAYYRFKTKHLAYPIPEQILPILCRNAGMFPCTQETAMKMADELLKSILYFTVVSPWWKLPFSLELYNKLSRTSDFVELHSFECYLSEKPEDWWTARLAANTKVLVISPFASSIESQVPRLDKVWASRPGFWNPTLQFKTLAFPLSFGIQSPDQQAGMLEKWTDSLGLINDFKKQMDAIDYDVVLIGVGIHSLPLMAHAKQQGKRAIHLGGSTQLYFGIRGGRWDGEAAFEPFFNDAWVRPSEKERPTHYTSVEKGCYW